MRSLIALIPCKGKTPEQIVEELKTQLESKGFLNKDKILSSPKL